MTIKQVPKLDNRCRILISDCDFTRKLKPSALFSYFQEIAGLHADNQGAGIDTLAREHGAAWVLTRMRVDVTRYPDRDEEVILETWPQEPRKYEFDRDYLMRDLAGNIIARGVSVWVVLDVSSRRLVRSEVIWRGLPGALTERAIDCAMGKIKLPPEPAAAYKRRIGCSDTDMNGHLNNSKYVDFIMDCFSMEQLRRRRAGSIKVNYLSEAFPGDTMVMLTADGAPGSGRVYVEGIKEGDGGTVFVAQVDLTAGSQESE
jgi:acyl-ACP thioesterase